jgi:PAS domain S-box-containing protein
MKRTGNTDSKQPRVVRPLAGFAPEIIKSIKDPFAIMNRDYKILYANKAMAYIHQSDREDFIGEICYDVFWKRTEPCEDCIIKEVFDAGRARVKEMWMDFPDGIRRWGEVKAYPVRGEDKTVNAVVAMVIDVTSRKQDLEKQKEYSALLSKKLREKSPKIQKIQYDEELSFQVSLSKRETEILRLLSEGYSNVQIAEILSISSNTTKSHVNHIFNKLGVGDRTQAAVLAVRFNLI